jgi:ATP-dependent DNA helicase PIF1
LLNCKAKTLHSWAGIGLGNGTIEQLITKIKKNKFAKCLWKMTEILVVDEVSMLSLKLFNLLNEIGKVIRGNQKPFGGIQVIFSGDFLQLPPVGEVDDVDSQCFCFESSEWNVVFPRENQIQLQRIFRQKDEIFSKILSELRIGRITKKTNELLMSQVGKDLDPNFVTKPTYLFPTRRQVEAMNLRSMCELDGEVHVFELKRHVDLEMTKKEKFLRMQHTSKDIELELDFLSNNLICERCIELKVGCQVMCTVNITSDESNTSELILCNGSQGIITEFCPLTKVPIVKFNNGTIRAMNHHIWKSENIPGIGVSQIPLILAWSLTIHKSQGSTLDLVCVDVGSSIFESGQTYVCMSRSVSLSRMYISSFDTSKISVNKKAKEFYENLAKNR